LSGELEATKLSIFSKIARLKQWLSRPDAPKFLEQCRKIFDKAFGVLSGLEDDGNEPIIAESAFVAIPKELKSVLSDSQLNSIHGKVALRAYHKFEDVMFARSSTHIGSSLIFFHPDGNLNKSPTPGTIEFIVARRNSSVVYVVRRQQPSPAGTIDPFRRYPDFQAAVYSTSLSDTREIVDPSWVTSHYARWHMDQHRAVILMLSPVNFVKQIDKNKT
jgi:hypothetical protein